MSREMKKMIDCEVDKFPDIERRYENRGKHPAIVLRRRGVERFVTFTSTRTDKRGMLNKVHDVRRVIRELSNG